jgi:glucose-6-phosphate isomerase
VEILASYEPTFRFMAEWWKQLFGESEGKNGIGIFPASVEYTADLHSMGQYIQDGPRRLIETVVSFEHAAESLKVPFELGDRDKLNYLAGREFGEIAKTVAKAVTSAHIKGDVPNISLSVPERNEEGFAALVCFFEMSCALSAYVSGVNPFNQPGVEAYKSNMFKLLGQAQA